jgi:hypothetical protein
MIFKKINYSDVSEINTVNYDHYDYVKTTREHIIYLFGVPTACVSCPEDEELLEYAKENGILCYDYWILTSENEEYVIDGEDVEDDGERLFCISSDNSDGIEFLKSMIKKNRWPVADHIRKKIFIEE